jgi:hypothetical protein
LIHKFLSGELCSACADEHQEAVENEISTASTSRRSSSRRRKRESGEDEEGPPTMEQLDDEPQDMKQGAE